MALQIGIGNLGGVSTNKTGREIIGFVLVD